MASRDTIRILDVGLLIEYWLEATLTGLQGLSYHINSLLVGKRGCYMMNCVVGQGILMSSTSMVLFQLQSRNERPFD